MMKNRWVIGLIVIVQLAQAMEPAPYTYACLPRDIDREIMGYALLDDEVIKEIQHHGLVSAIAYSPDGTCIASGGDDKKVTIRDAATYDTIKEIKHRGWVRAIAYSPDGTYIASGGKKDEVIIRDVAIYRIIKDLWDCYWVFSIAYSPDGACIASCGEDDQVIIHDTATYDTIKEIKHDRLVRAIAYSPDGACIALGGADSKVTIYDTATYSTIKEIEHDNWVEAIAYSPDGAAIASGGYDKKVTIRDTFTMLLNPEKKRAIKNLKQLMLAKKIADRSKKEFLLNEESCDTWHSMKAGYGNEFRLYRGKQSERMGIKAWKLVRNESNDNCKSVMVVMKNLLSVAREYFFDQ